MSGGYRHDDVALVEVIDRVIQSGVVLHGDLVLSVADIDLVYVRLDLLLASVSTARRLASQPTGAANPDGETAHPQVES
jgi:gas vesicle structural protein